MYKILTEISDFIFKFSALLKNFTIKIYTEHVNLDT